MTEPRYLIDPYREWAEGEGIPVVRGFGVDLLEVDVRPWARSGGMWLHRGC